MEWSVAFSCRFTLRSVGSSAAFMGIPYRFVLIGWLDERQWMGEEAIRGEKREAVFSLFHGKRSISCSDIRLCLGDVCYVGGTIENSGECLLIILFPISMAM